ncbi:MAG: restriction endonuclease subunit S [Trichloromonadaceae bacterium]
MGIYDCPHSTPKLSTDGPYIVRTQDIREGYFKKDEAAHVSMETYRERVKRVVPSYGDILLSREGTYFGDAAEVPKDTLVCLGQRMVLLRPDAKIIRGSFLRILINSNSFQKYLLSLRDGSVAERLNVSTIRKLPVIVPPVEYQDLVMGHLIPIEEKIANSRGINQTLEQIAQTTFKSWFVDFEPVKAKIEAKVAGRDPERAAMCAISGKLEPELDQLSPEQYQQLAATAALFPDELVESELGWIPAGWEAGSVYRVSDVIYGAPFASAKFNTDGVGRPLIRIRDLKDEAPGVFTSEVHPKGYLVQPGDIVVGMDGEFRAYLWGGQEAWLNQRVCVFKPKMDISAAFIRSSIMPCLAAVEASETATTVIHLGKNDIDRFMVVTPQLSLMAAFGAIAEPVYAQVVALKQSSRTLATLRDTLLPKLLSGELSIETLPLEATA